MSVRARLTTIATIAATALTLAIAGPAQAALPPERTAPATLGASSSEVVFSASGSTIVLMRSLGASTTNPDVSFGWGPLGYRIYFTQTDQKVIAAGGGAGIASLICGASLGIGCATAAGLVAGGAIWISEHGGICTGAKPRLRLTMVGMLTPVYECVK